MVGPPRLLTAPAPHEPAPPLLHPPMPRRAARARTDREPAVPGHRMRRRDLRRERGAAGEHGA
ncbi:hypothetical protein LAWI1_G008991, partial [Lachnellula willkommii]